MVFLAPDAMPEFVIEREIPGAGQMTEEQVRDISVRSLEVLKGIGPQIQWLHSYVTDDRLYCVYLAPDEAVDSGARAQARRAGQPHLGGAAADRSHDATPERSGHGRGAVSMSENPIERRRAALPSTRSAYASALMRVARLRQRALDLFPLGLLGRRANPLADRRRGTRQHDRRFVA